MIEPAWEKVNGRKIALVEYNGSNFSLVEFNGGSFSLVEYNGLKIELVEYRDIIKTVLTSIWLFLQKDVRTVC